jgi:hypothetical protein
LLERESGCVWWKTESNWKGVTVYSANCQSVGGHKVGTPPRDPNTPPPSSDAFDENGVAVTRTETNTQSAREMRNPRGPHAFDWFLKPRKFPKEGFKLALNKAAKAEIEKIKNAPALAPKSHVSSCASQDCDCYKALIVKCGDRMVKLVKGYSAGMPEMHVLGYANKPVELTAEFEGWKACKKDHAAVLEKLAAEKPDDWGQEKKNESYQSMLQEAEEDLARKEADLDKLKTDADADLKQRQENLDKKKKTHEEGSSAHEAEKKELSDKNARKKELESELGKLKEDLEKENQQYAAKVKDPQFQSAPQQRAIRERHDTAVEELEEQIEETEAAIDEVGRRISDLEETVGKYTSEKVGLEGTQKMIDQLEEQYNAKLEELDKLVKEADKKKKDIQQLVVANRSLEEKYPAIRVTAGVVEPKLPHTTYVVGGRQVTLDVYTEEMAGLLSVVQGIKNKDPNALPNFASVRKFVIDPILQPDRTAPTEFTVEGLACAGAEKLGVKVKVYPWLKYALDCKISYEVLGGSVSDEDKTALNELVGDPPAPFGSWLDLKNAFDTAPELESFRQSYPEEQDTSKFNPRSALTGYISSKVDFEVIPAVRDFGSEEF